MDHGAVDLYVDGGGCFCYNGKCYFQLEGGNGRLYTKSRYADRVDVGAMAYGPLKDLAKKVGLLLPKYSFKVSFRFCNGKEVVQLGRYPWDACVDRQLILEKIKQPLQNRSDKAWKITHINKLKRKPKVVYGPVASIQKDTKGNFVIPMAPPPTMATSVWEEVVYEYHSDGFEEWSIPVGTIEHEKVKRLTRKFDYDYLRAEADRFKLEMEEERKATPPKVQEDAITKELEDGFLLFSDVEKCKGKSENNDAILVLPKGAQHSFSKSSSMGLSRTDVGGDERIKFQQSLELYVTELNSITNKNSKVWQLISGKINAIRAAMIFPDTELSHAVYGCVVEDAIYEKDRANEAVLLDREWEMWFRGLYPVLSKFLMAGEGCGIPLPDSISVSRDVMSDGHCIYDEDNEEPLSLGGIKIGTKLQDRNVTDKFITVHTDIAFMDNHEAIAYVKDGQVDSVRFMFFAKDLDQYKQISEAVVDEIRAFLQYKNKDFVVSEREKNGEKTTTVVVSVFRKHVRYIVRVDLSRCLKLNKPVYYVTAMIMFGNQVEGRIKAGKVKSDSTDALACPIR